MLAAVDKFEIAADSSDGEAIDQATEDELLADPPEDSTASASETPRLSRSERNKE